MFPGDPTTSFAEARGYSLSQQVVENYSVAGIKVSSLRGILLIFYDWKLGQMCMFVLRPSCFLMWCAKKLSVLVCGKTKSEVCLHLTSKTLGVQTF